MRSVAGAVKTSNGVVANVVTATVVSSAFVNICKFRMPNKVITTLWAISKKKKRNMQAVK